jgi:hypothetical protein
MGHFTKGLKFKLPRKSVIICGSTSVFLLGKAQPWNANVKPPPQIWKQLQASKLVFKNRQIFSYREN